MNVLFGKRGGLEMNFKGAISSWEFHLLISSLVIVLVFVHPPAIFSGDTDTARNYLNTIVSSLSTILALCISIILVAIQMTASNYTHRVLDFFVRLPYNVSLFLIYLVTIMHSFFLMSKIQDPLKDPLPPRLRPEMSADLVLVVICFLSLLIYMYAVIQLLKPERIIELVLRDYKRAAAEGRWQAALENVEQICDIAKRAASVSDSVTGMICLESLLHVAEKLPLPENEDDPMLGVHQSLLDQLGEIVGVAIKEKETGVLQAVLGALYTQGYIYINGHAWIAAELVIKAYRDLVFSHLMPEGLVYNIQSVAERLYRLAAHAARHQLRGRQFSLRTWRIILAIGENAFRLESGLPALVPGFLMAREIPDLFYTLGDNEEQLAEGLTTYFELFKACAKGALQTDVARLFTWWDGHLSETDAYEPGHTLAWLIACHVERKDLAKTILLVCDKQPQELELEFVTAFVNARQLFDGESWQDLHI
jgi:hypothetical protein